MKKIFFFYALVTIVACQNSVQYANHVIDQSHDSIIMTEYLNSSKTSVKYKKLQNVADSISNEIIEEAGRLNRITNTDSSLEVIYRYIGLAIQVSEINHGIKKTAENLLSVMEFPYDSYSFPEKYFNHWYKNSQLIESMCSDSLLKEIKDSVIRKKNDPILKSHYMFKWQITKDIKNFSEHEALFYAYTDTLHQLKILGYVSDKELKKAICSDILSDERRLQVARSIHNFSYAECFFLKTEEEKHSFFLESINEFKGGYGLLVTAEKYNETDNPLLLKSLKRMSTFSLTGNFFGKSVDKPELHFEKEEWKHDFSYIEFASIIINSVKNHEDFDDAIQFFNLNGHNGEEDKMYSLLVHKKGNLF